MDAKKVSGLVLGVEVGNTFKYRQLLDLFGLHCHTLLGIDYTKIRGKNLAISIVDSHRYLNESERSDMLTYCGEGGIGVFGRKSPPKDQKLERATILFSSPNPFQDTSLMPHVFSDPLEGAATLPISLISIGSKTMFGLSKMGLYSCNHISFSTATNVSCFSPESHVLRVGPHYKAGRKFIQDKYMDMQLSMTSTQIHCG
nr:SRA-YDG, PUA-like domain protein [Tanacetum cinerariifolium]